MESHVRHRLSVQRHMYPSFTRVVSVSSILEPHREHCWQLAKSLGLTKKLRTFWKLPSITRRRDRSWQTCRLHKQDRRCDWLFPNSANSFWIWEPNSDWSHMGKECGSKESTRLWGGALRDEPKNGCEGDYKATELPEGDRHSNSCGWKKKKRADLLELYKIAAEMPILLRRTLLSIFNLAAFLRFLTNYFISCWSTSVRQEQK